MDIVSNTDFPPDLSIFCSDGVLVCHKLIIVSFAPFLKELLTECKSSAIIIPDIKDVIDVVYGVKSETSNEAKMKEVFVVMCVNSRGILINNNTCSIGSSAKTKKGMKRLCYKVGKYKSNPRSKIYLSEPEYKSMKVHNIPEDLSVTLDEITNEVSDIEIFSEVSDAPIKSEHFEATEISELKNSQAERKILEQPAQPKMTKNKKPDKDHDNFKTEKIDEKQYPCDQCPKICTRKENLVMHKRLKHKEIKFKIIVGSRLCSFCNISFKRKDILKHIKEVHPTEQHEFSCENCASKLSSKSKLKRHMASHMQKIQKLFCDQCAFETFSEESLGRHIRRHNSEIKCAHCDYFTANKINLERHFLKLHNAELQETEFVCNTCNKCLVSKNALKMHKRRHH